MNNSDKPTKATSSIRANRYLNSTTFDQISFLARKFIVFVRDFGLQPTKPNYPPEFWNFINNDDKEKFVSLSCKERKQFVFHTSSFD